MISPAVRQIVGATSAARIALSAFPHSHVRCYTTPTSYKQEQDPQLNGYPELPNISNQYRDPKGWWDEQRRRNFGDTLHEEDELYSMWGPDIPVVPPQTALYHFTIAVLGFVSFGFLAKYCLVPDIPAVRREYPDSEVARELGIRREKPYAQDDR